MTCVWPASTEATQVGRAHEAEHSLYMNCRAATSPSDKACLLPMETGATMATVPGLAKVVAE